jgi:hypothetical protein
LINCLVIQPFQFVSLLFPQQMSWLSFKSDFIKLKIERTKSQRWRIRNKWRSGNLAWDEMERVVERRRRSMKEERKNQNWRRVGEGEGEGERQGERRISFPWNQLLLFFSFSFILFFFFLLFN